MKDKLLTDAQWEKIEPLMPTMPKGKKGGRPWAENRDVLSGILWVLKTGARWRDLPETYPSDSTCWRRLKEWEEQGLWLDIWRVFLGELDEKGWLEWDECFADGSFSPAKKGAIASEKPKREKEQSFWWWSTARVFLWEGALLRRRRMKLSSSKKPSKR